jgi:hypothetical protein
VIRWTFLATVALAVLGALWIPTVSAQATDTPAIERRPQASSYGDGQLKSFALAAINVVRLRTVDLPKSSRRRRSDRKSERRRPRRWCGQSRARV